MRSRFPSIMMALGISLICILNFTTALSAQAGAGVQGGASAESQRRRGGGFYGGPGGGRGILGAVTEVTGEHFTVKTEAGELYTVHYSVNTRIMKQPPGSGKRGAPGGGRDAGSPRDPEAEMERMQPLPIKPVEIKVGDFVTAGGEMDAANRSIGAVFVLLVDAESARQMREMQANFGKTWLAGRITAMDGTRITIEGAIDHSRHAIDVDENTSFRRRREPITLADMHVGDQIRTEGAPQSGVFLAKSLNDLGVLSSEGAGPGGAQPQ